MRVAENTGITLQQLRLRNSALELLMVNKTTEGNPMKIEISGHHVDITDAISADIEKKLEKIKKCYPSLIHIDVILSKQHNEHHVEISTNYEGAKLAAHGKNEVLYPALNNAIKKLEASLTHRKGQLKANLRKEPVLVEDVEGDE